MIKVRSNFYLQICLVLSILGVSTMVLQAQDKFHRLYPAQNDKNVLSLDAIQTKDGSYIALHIELEEQENPQDTIYGDTLIITSFKPKGDVNWSKSIALSGSYKSFNPQLASLVQAQNDSIYYTVVAFNDKLPVNLMGSFHLNGNLGFFKASGTIANEPDNFGPSSLMLNYNKSLFHAYSGIAAKEQSIFISRKGYNGNSAWVKSLNTTNGNVNTDESLLGFELADDTTFIMTGVVDSLDAKPFLAVFDTLGNPIMSKSYRDLNFNGSTPLSYNAHKFSDGSYVLTGYLIHEVTPPFNIEIKGFVIKTDATGNVTWSKKLVVNAGDYTIVKHSIVDKDNNIVLAGTNFSFTNQEIYPFMLKMDRSGKVLWKKKFDRTDNSFDFTGSLFQTRDNGYVYYTTSSKDGLTVPSFIKTNKEGETGCETDMTENILVDNAFKADTLVWKVSNATNFSNDLVLKTKAHNFEVPVLTLAVKPFCPNEPIDWTFDAKVEGATAYKWSDNSTADTLRVFKEGEYSVMVTIDEDVCFVLCDTAKLERYTKPQAQINLSLGNFCTNGKQTLSLGYQPGHPNLKTINWSTGESAIGSIEIATPGTYSVTIVDECNETATATINVGPFPQKLSAATISGNPTVNCIRGTISGLLTASGNAMGLGDMTYRWSTGASTAALSINDSEVLTYTVTVADVCGTTATATKVVELKGAPTDFQITKSITGLCKDKSIRLNITASAFSPKLKYNWSTNVVTPAITITQAGTYSATLTDGCNNSVSKEIKIEESEFAVEDLVYAKLFLPDGTLAANQVDTSDAYKDAELYNRSFGPVDQEKYCFDDITEYELHVFNRWGQEVFVSNRITEEWDGTYQDKAAPSESYLWVAKYKILGVAKTLKGSVTMLRK
jgi:gliding motility-associated-like protein